MMGSNPSGATKMTHFPYVSQIKCGHFYGDMARVAEGAALLRQ